MGPDFPPSPAINSPVTAFASLCGLQLPSLWNTASLNTTSLMHNLRLFLVICILFHPPTLLSHRLIISISNPSHPRTPCRRRLVLTHASYNATLPAADRLTLHLTFERIPSANTLRRHGTTLPHHTQAPSKLPFNLQPPCVHTPHPSSVLWRRSLSRLPDRHHRQQATQAQLSVPSWRLTHTAPPETLSLDLDRVATV